MFTHSNTRTKIKAHIIIAVKDDQNQLKVKLLYVADLSYYRPITMLSKRLHTHATHQQIKMIHR